MIQLRQTELHRIQLRARMPFRYGIVTMTEVPHVILRATFEIEGKVHEGLAADHLPPKWFTKDPNRALADEIDEMLVVIRAAVAGARTIQAATPFQFWQQLYAAQGKWGVTHKIPPLLVHFGTSLVERALIDAFCRSVGNSFAGALHENRFGVDLGAMHAPLAGTAPRDWLPASPPQVVFARHTVGLVDYIEEAEIPAAERVNDGLPQSLAACVKFYGLRHFKIKIDADVTRAKERLLKIAAVLERECGADFAYSLDGNESFRDPAVFAAQMRALLAEPALQKFWPKLLFIEQPLHRDVALTRAADWSAWPERPPIIIDESDAELSSLPTALELGYAGTSHKNCKGIFKGVGHACLLALRRSAGLPAMLSGEDLTNVGPVALLQDLAVQAALGVTSVERNGHHYFAGLGQFPAAIQQHVLAHHGDLYTRSAAGWPRLEVRDGKIQLGTALAAPFGCAPGLDLTALELVPLNWNIPLPMNSRFVSLMLVVGGIALGSLHAGSPIVDTMPADGMPQVTHWEYPVYPPDALKQKVEGNLTVRAVVNTAGEVTEARVLSPLDPRLDEAAVAAVKKWKFSPGLEYGKPIIVSMDVPIRFSVVAAYKKPKAGLMPPSDLWPQPSPRTEVAERNTPGGDYPEILTQRKIRGSVTVACTVNEEGRAIAPRVTGATHVDFIKPALDALAQWEFAPATQGDLKVKAPVETKITFDALSNQRAEILAGNGITAPDGSEPPVAPEPYIVADPVRPYELLMAGQGGSASAEFTVEPNGAVTGVKVRETSAPEYGHALVAALETWGFYAARANGNAVSVPLLLRMEFKAVTAGQESDTDPVERLVAALRAGKIGPPKNLDERLTPIFRLPPAYPAAFKEGESPAGEAKIEFVIDREGRARLPRVVSASREEFGWSAATAVSQWVFRAPRRGGELVDVLVQIPFEFSAPRK